MYVRGYLQSSENGRVVTIELREESIKKKKKHKLNQSIQYLILFN
jgi:hypothetical protein